MAIARVFAAACVSAGLLAAFPAWAGCTLKTQQIPVTMHGLRPLVTAKVNGREGQFLLDSGSYINILNGQFAAERKLRPQQMSETGSKLTVNASVMGNGAAGVETVSGVVVAQSFEFGGAAFRNVGFMASPRFTEVEGVLGQPFLKSTDVEYDLAGGMVRLVKPEGCKDTDMVYWAKDGQGYSVIPLEWADRSVDPTHPSTMGSVYVNGVRLRAMFDTGAPTSFVTKAGAERAGVKTSDPGVESIGKGQGLDASFDAWEATFASIKIGDEEIKNAPLTIGRSLTEAFDVLIGADFFLSHHIYVANSQDKLYFTYSGGPVFRMGPPRRQAAN